MEEARLNLAWRVPALGTWQALVVMAEEAEVALFEVLVVDQPVEQLPEALCRRHHARSLTAQLRMISILSDLSCTGNTYIPKLRPSSEVGVIDSSIRTHMLPRPNHHISRWGDEYDRRSMWICTGYPDRDRKLVSSPSEIDRDCARHVQQ
jgi:hypothetical protein